MNKYSYATDSSTGTVTADSLQEAYDHLRANISDEMINDGASLFVEDESGERITLGIDGE